MHLTAISPTFYSCRVRSSAVIALCLDATDCFTHDGRITTASVSVEWLTGGDHLTWLVAQS